MKPDIEKFMTHMDQFDMTDEEKTQFIEALWTMMENFVDQAFDQSNES